MEYWNMPPYHYCLAKRTLKNCQGSNLLLMKPVALKGIIILKVVPA